MKVQELLEYRNTSRDQFGRNYPVKLTLQNGETLIGQIGASEYEGEKFKIRIFKVIENLDDWNTNKIEFGTKIISLNNEEIKGVSIYNEY